MTNRRKSTPEDDRLVRDDRADWGDRMSAIHNVAVDHLVYLEADIAKLLDHESDGLRATAILALVMHWNLERYVPRALELLRDDPEATVRMHAAVALGSYASGDARARPDLLRALALALQSDVHAGVARKAYVAMLRSLAPDLKTTTIPTVDFDRTRDVDRALIAPYLPS